jgi:hypothetical protein
MAEREEAALKPHLQAKREACREVQAKRWEGRLLPLGAPNRHLDQSLVQDRPSPQKKVVPKVSTVTARIRRTRKAIWKSWDAVGQMSRWQLNMSVKGQVSTKKSNKASIDFKKTARACGAKLKSKPCTIGNKLKMAKVLSKIRLKGINAAQFEQVQDVFTGVVAKVANVFEGDVSVSDYKNDNRRASKVVIDTDVTLTGSDADSRSQVQAVNTALKNPSTLQAALQAQAAFSSTTVDSAEATTEYEEGITTSAVGERTAWSVTTTALALAVALWRR